MKEQITPEMIAKCQEILQHAQYDGNEFKAETGPFGACSITASLFPEILDMALELLKRKCSYSLVEWIEQEPKTNNKDIIIEKNATITKVIKNYTLPKYAIGQSN